MKPALQKNNGIHFKWVPNSLKNSVRFKLIVVVFLALTIMGVGLISLDYWDELKRNKEQVETNFSMLADVLENDINRWMTYRENDVKSMAANPMVRQYINEINGAGESEQSVRKLENYWRDLQEQHHIYDEIYFITNFGQILASTNSDRRNTIRPRDDLINKPLETGNIYFQDAYLSISTRKPSIAFSIPVTGNRPVDGVGTDYIGLLVYRIDIEDVLHPLLQSRGNLGNTGEVILINEFRTAITELRSRPGSALRYNLKSEPAVRVAQGEEGTWQGVGYNGHEMFGVYRYIPKTHWGVIVRQDTSEIFGPLTGQLHRFLWTSVLAVVLILSILFIILSKMLMPVTVMAGVARDISKGNFNRRVNNKTTDEIGILGESLNSMACELDKQFRIQKSRENVLHSLVETLDLSELVNKSLIKFCRSFDFKVGAVFLFDPEKDVLVRKAIYCPGEKLLERTENIKMGEGLEGLTAVSLEPQFITDIPEDTAYTVNWLGGNMLPATIIMIPLKFGSELLGVMSLASLKRFSESETHAIATIGNIMGVAINNAKSFEKTRDLSYKLQDLNEQLAEQNEELNAQSEELQSQTEELQTQSEELQAITQELQAKNAELEKVDIRKSNYLATLSHELRAPLNAVISFSDVLLDGVVGKLNQKQEKYVNEIIISGQHLLNLINDILDLSKIEAGQMELNISEVDPALPLEESLTIVSAEMERKKLQITNLVVPNTYIVLADAAKLKQVFLNLLSNAVKFTPEGGRISIEAKIANDILNISFSDTGIGIAREYQEEIFEEFKQAGSAGVGSLGGTGLGLAITRKLLNLQSGRIYLESEEGRGTTFTVTLPVISRENYVSEQFKCNIQCPEERNCEYCACPRANVTYLPKPLNKTALLESLESNTCHLVRTPPGVLVIDDDQVVRNYASVILESYGYNVITAEDGEQGVKLALSEEPDFIILDIYMPEKNGLQVLNEISKHNWKNGLSVFICTNKSLTMEENKFIEARVKDIYRVRQKTY